jgi:transcriptional regulator
MRFDRELLKGTTETFILAVVAETPCHGYQLVKQLQRQSEGILQLGEGTLYPRLYKLEAKGWITGTWDTGSTGRRRRVYRITTCGRRQLAQRAKQWAELARGMALVLGETAHA